MTAHREGAVSRSAGTLRSITPKPIRRAVGRAWLDRTLARSFFADREELQRYKSELASSGLPRRLTEARNTFYETVAGTTARGDRYAFGGLGPEAGPRLYALVRKHRPSVLIETGVCNGVSSALILQALSENEHGQLHSIDFPEREGESAPVGRYWDGKGGAVIPAGRSPGWVVPDHLRGRWDLTVGRSQEVLRPLLERLGAVDFFLHDSEHSYECMMFEFSTVYPHVTDGGIVASDDVGWNAAFSDFTASVSRPIQPLGDGAAVIRK